MQLLTTNINEQGFLLITINRADKMNALNTQLLQELASILEQYKADDAVKGVVITGAGNKAFAAGADISEFQNFDTDGGRKMAANAYPIFKLIECYPKAIIAAVNGYALGGGCELAMACHIRVASTNARFGQPEVNLGIIPGYGGTQRLIQLIGKGKALELLMTGDMVKADQALQLGLVNHLVAQEELLPKCYEILTKIATKAPFAISQIIDCVDAYFTNSKDGFAAEIDAFAACCNTEDFKEGTTAFLEKRKANFKGK